MKILADENLALIAELFEPLGSVTAMPGREIAAANLQDVDVLLIRSVTRVDEELLANADNLFFIGSATIGHDHMDTKALDKRGIAWASAPGCNAEAVADYVLGALVQVLGDRMFTEPLSFGLLGFGNTAQAIARRIDALAQDSPVSWIAHDPFRHETHLQSLDQVLACDVVSLHVPLTLPETSNHPTFHLINEQILALFSTQQVLINACRGAVIDSNAVESLSKMQLPKLIFDVWEHEPSINAALFERVSLGTQHIAGYSLAGKINGSIQICKALLGQENTARLVPAKKLEVSRQAVNKASLQKINLKNLEIQSLGQLVSFVKEIEPLHKDMRKVQAELSAGNLPEAFDCLRKNYRLRHEFSQYRLSGVISLQMKSLLCALGFDCQ